MLTFSFAANWPPSTSTARQTSKCVLQEDSVTGGGSSRGSPSPPYGRSVRLSFSCHAVTACMPWPRPVFYSGISTGSHQICDWHSQQKSALRDIHLLFHQQTVWKQLLKKVNASGGVHGGAYENQKGRNSSSVSRWVVAWMHYNIYGPKCRD